MSDCCSPAGYRWAFSEKRARKEAQRYERRGLDATPRRVVERVALYGVEGRTLLEVGGGVGALQVELLKMGVTHAVNVEITPTYEDAATGLLRRTGLEDRVDRKVMDFVDAGSDAEAADIVIMNRVICCYPDMPKLVAAAAAHCRQVLVMSFPKDRWWTRTSLAAGNVVLRVTRRHIQIFVHPPDTILAVAAQHGLTVAFNQPGRFWQVAELRRSA
jgi:2-polyprenyl-3-methyl-5-hydroxy-6-metoxy-1,4-benzoquinol methylase